MPTVVDVDVLVTQVGEPGGLEDQGDLLDRPLVDITVVEVPGVCMHAAQHQSELCVVLCVPTTASARNPQQTGREPGKQAGRQAGAGSLNPIGGVSATPLPPAPEEVLPFSGGTNVAAAAALGSLVVTLMTKGPVTSSFALVRTHCGYICGQMYTIVHHDRVLDHAWVRYTHADTCTRNAPGRT